MAALDFLTNISTSGAATTTTPKRPTGSKKLGGRGTGRSRTLIQRKLNDSNPPDEGLAGLGAGVGAGEGGAGPSFQKLSSGDGLAVYVDEPTGLSTSLSMGASFIPITPLVDGDAKSPDFDGEKEGRGDVAFSISNSCDAPDDFESRYLCVACVDSFPSVDHFTLSNFPLIFYHNRNRRPDDVDDLPLRKKPTNRVWKNTHAFSERDREREKERERDYSLTNI